MAQATAYLCDRAAMNAAKDVGIPFAVMQAISRVETGRVQNGKLAPWPWAINIEGKGDWFSEKVDLIERAKQSLEQGKTSFDVGCFQLNYRWHGNAFPDIDTMIDPMQYASYAARFL